MTVAIPAGVAASAVVPAPAAPPAPGPAAMLTGAQKAAVLVMQLGRERSAPILAQLREAEVEELAAEIIRLRSVDAEVHRDPELAMTVESLRQRLVAIPSWP